jgi:hypothetical protein
MSCRYLITWLFEDRLRKLYLQFLENLSLVGKDTIEKTRVKVWTLDSAQNIFGVDRVYSVRLSSHISTGTLRVPELIFHGTNCVVSSTFGQTTIFD